MSELAVTVGAVSLYAKALTTVAVSSILLNVFIHITELLRGAFIIALVLLELLEAHLILLEYRLMLS